MLTRGAYAAKSGKSVSPKAAKRRSQVWRAAPAKPGTPLAALRQDSGQACFNIPTLESFSTGGNIRPSLSYSEKDTAARCRR